MFSLEAKDIATASIVSSSGGIWSTLKVQFALIICGTIPMASD